MKREMLKSYESPLTVRTQVALESGICAASADVANPKELGEISAQEVNDGFTTDFTSSDETNVWK